MLYWIWFWFCIQASCSAFLGHVWQETTSKCISKNRNCSGWSDPWSLLCRTKENSCNNMYMLLWIVHVLGICSGHALVFSSFWKLEGPCGGCPVQQARGPVDASVFVSLARHLSDPGSWAAFCIGLLAATIRCRLWSASFHASVCSAVEHRSMGSSQILLALRTISSLPYSQLLVSGM